MGKGTRTLLVSRDDEIRTSLQRTLEKLTIAVNVAQYQTIGALITTGKRRGR